MWTKHISPVERDGQKESSKAPFGMGRTADAVAELILSPGDQRVGDRVTQPGASTAVGLFAPQHTRSVDLNDVGHYPVIPAVVGDSLFTGLDGPVVINNAKATGRKSRVEGVKGLNGGFVEVAIESQHSDAIDRGFGERVFEPAGQKPNAIIEEAVTVEIRPDIRFRYPEYA
jgi:hypothetical protein